MKRGWGGTWKGEVGFRSAGSGSEEEIRQLWNEQDKQMSIRHKLEESLPFSAKAFDTE